MNKKHKQSKEKEIVYKKWFSPRPLIEKFCNTEERGEQTAFAKRLGFEYGRITLLLKPEYLISVYKADEYAVRLGYHPANIWPDWFDEEPEEGSNPKVRKKKKQQPKA